MAFGAMEWAKESDEDLVMLLLHFEKNMIKSIGHFLKRT
jgi:hypothetical protein